MLRGLFLFFKVGIILHYSTLATVLWLGVTSRNIYKQVTKKAKRCQDTDEPPPPPRPMLRWACCLLVQRCLPDHHAHILTRNYKGQNCFFPSAIQVASRFLFPRDVSEDEVKGAWSCHVTVSASLLRLWLQL